MPCLLKADISPLAYPLIKNNDYHYCHHRPQWKCWKESPSSPDQGSSSWSNQARGPTSTFFGYRQHPLIGREEADGCVRPQIAQGIGQRYQRPSVCGVVLSKPQVQLTLRSTIGHEGFALQESLLDALTGSPDIVTFIPASFGAIWTEEILQKPTVRAFHEPYDRLSAKAKELGIGFTQVRAGLFLEFTFMAG
jgi:hypothetical protein